MFDDDAKLLTEVYKDIRLKASPNLNTNIQKEEGEGEDMSPTDPIAPAMGEIEQFVVKMKQMGFGQDEDLDEELMAAIYKKLHPPGTSFNSPGDAPNPDDYPGDYPKDINDAEDIQDKNPRRPYWGKGEY